MMTLYRVTVTVPPDAPANVSRREFERQFLTTFTELEPDLPLRFSSTWS